MNQSGLATMSSEDCIWVAVTEQDDILTPSRPLQGESDISFVITASGAVV